jgi:hypothetical protein
MIRLSAILPNNLKSYYLELSKLKDYGLKSTFILNYMTINY